MCARVSYGPCVGIGICKQKRKSRGESACLQKNDEMIFERLLLINLFELHDL